MSRRARAVLGSVVIGGALLYLAVTGIGDNLVYFLTPTELLAKGPAAQDQPLRLSGQVEPGSVQWDPATLELKFRIRDEQSVIDVESTGAPPQMFQDGMNVVVEGALLASGVFESTSVMVKHSNEYGPGEGEAHPERTFSKLTGEGTG
jgi:cytochrome c-type biogenesis protein CcmE